MPIHDLPMSSGPGTQSLPRNADPSTAWNWAELIVDFGDTRAVQSTGTSTGTVAVSVPGPVPVEAAVMTARRPEFVFVIQARPAGVNAT